MFYYSFPYKGFCLQQTKLGWEILGAPNWSRKGPIPPPPYQTQQMAERVIDVYYYDQ